MNRRDYGSVYHDLRDCGLCIALRARDTDKQSNCPIVII